jgi:peroxiredoxin
VLTGKTVIDTTPTHYPLTWPIQTHQMKSLIIALAIASSAIQSVTAQTLPAQATDISPLLIGEKTPNILLRDFRGGSDSLTHVLAKKPTVLIFYRGGWCPYCNTQLAELQSQEADIIRLGYQIVAISPDSPENLAGTVTKHDLNYQLYSDSKMELASAFGIAFQMPDNYRDRLSKWSGGLNTGLLPVPSVFVLNQQGEILFEYINPDYKKRIKGALLLAVLESLSR